MIVVDGPVGVGVVIVFEAGHSVLGSAAAFSLTYCPLEALWGQTKMAPPLQQLVDFSGNRQTWQEAKH